MNTNASSTKSLNDVVYKQSNKFQVEGRFSILGEFQFVYLDNKFYLIPIKLTFGSNSIFWYRHNWIFFIYFVHYYISYSNNIVDTLRFTFCHL